MKKLFTLTTLLFISLAGFAQTKAWEGMHSASIGDLESNYQLPPVEYAGHILWGWAGDMNAKIMKKDFDLMQSVNTRVVNIEPGYDFPYEYLSDDWFRMIKMAVEEAKKRDMKVWLIDDAKYPSGFAGGKFSRERPDLKMKALIRWGEPLEVKAGSSLTQYPVPSGVISAVAVSDGQANRMVPIKDGKITFIAGVHDWQIILVGTAFRSGNTRAVNLKNHGKDTTNFLHDYMNPEAVDQFIEWTHEAAKKVVGDEMGKTIMGYRGDEPDYSYTPWTDSIIETFKQMKGYDPTPYLASLFAETRTEYENRVRADYWDVWSTVFAEVFFQRQSDWCAENGMAFYTHLNNEHTMPVCVTADGDFFRLLSKTPIPGVDAISNHIAPGVDNDFPKLAPSVSHVYGKPRAFSETMGAVRGDEKSAKYLVNHQFARGINFFEYNFWSSKSATKESLAQKPWMGPMTDYINRTSYLFSMGIPGARVAMYYPTMSMWLGNNVPYQTVSDISQMLMRHQIDFDYINDDAFTEVMKVGAGYLENASGQKYNLLIIPQTDVISAAAWEVIDSFIQSGGKVLFWGGRPNYLVEKTFTDMKPFPDAPRAIYEPYVKWTKKVASIMPEREMEIEGDGTDEFANASRRRAPVPGQKFDVVTSTVDRFMKASDKVAATDSIRYTRRVLNDGDLYFIFNEGEQPISFAALFDVVGRVQEWDGYTGKVTEIPFEITDNRTRVEMTIEGYGSKVITIRKQDKKFDIRQFGAVGDGVTVNTKAIQSAIDAAHANGGGCIVVEGGNYMTGALFFKDGVDLEVKEGAMLTGTTNQSDYPVISTRFEGIEVEHTCALLNFDHSRNVRVYGGGTINGNGLAWPKRQRPAQPQQQPKQQASSVMDQLAQGVSIAQTMGSRPRLLCFTDCPGGDIRDLKMLNQSCWCLHVLYTDGFTIDNLEILAEAYIASSDGIDIDSSSNVIVRNTDINVYDDCISIKCGKGSDGRRVGRPSENILIENCNFNYGHGGIAMGSEISGGIRNVLVRNCVMGKNNSAPIRFKSQPSRGGLVENITFENIVLEGCQCMLECNMMWRMKGEFEAPAEKLSELRNIRLINVDGSVRVAGTIAGFDTEPMGERVFIFEDCDVKAERGISLQHTRQTDFSGLNLTVEQGEPIYQVGQAPEVRIIPDNTPNTQAK